MTVGQRIAVMREGQLEQVATPQELYDRPANRFVATFIGSPPMNLFESPSARAWFTDTLGDRFAEESLCVGIRPQDVTLVSPGLGTVVGTVDVVEPLGHMTVVHVRCDDCTRVVAVAPGRHDARPGDRVGLRFAAGRLHVFGSGGRLSEG